MNMTAPQKQQISNRMQKRHKEYARLRPQYDFLRSAYMGGPSYLQRNLFRHEPRESSVDFKRRLERAVYPNYVRPVIRTYRDHIFRHEDGIVRPQGDPGYLEWLKNVNRRGFDANRFWGSVVSRQMLYGWSAVLVDMPKAREGVETRADQLDAGDVPYLVHISPRQIVDWKLDDDGALAWVRIEEKTTHAPDPFVDPKDITRWRIWSRDSWMVVTEDGTVVEQGEHHLGVVPLVITRFEPPEEDDHVNDLAGVSFMDDFARINRMLANKVSEVDGFLAKNMLQILTIGVSLLAQMGEDADGQTSLKDGAILEHPSDGPAPSFIAPDVTGAAQCFTHIQNLRWELFRLATQKDVRGQASGDQGAASGVAKMVDFEEQNAVLSSLADGLQVAEQSATELWFQWQGMDVAVAEEIDYPDNYNLRSLEGDMAVALNVRDVYGTASPTFLATYLFELARRITDDMDEATQKTVMDELMSNLQNAQDQTNELGRMTQEAGGGSPFGKDDEDADDDDAEKTVV
jgi:hypothetical protein